MTPTTEEDFATLEPPPARARGAAAPAPNAAGGRGVVTHMLVGVGVAAVLGAGCGSVTALSTDAGGGGDGSGSADVAMETVVTSDQACADMAGSICGALDACAPFLVRVLYGDRPTCVSRWTLGCTGDQAVPGTNRTVADIVACGQAVSLAICTDLEASAFPAVCRPKPGARVDGSACGSDWQCQSTFCNKSGQCGVCGPKAGLGGACSVDDGCQIGLVCAANGRCVTPGTLGATCGANQPCRSDLYCTNPSAGTCSTKVGAAGSCADADAACDLVQGVACNPFNKVCQTVNVADPGQACGLIAGGLTVCVGLNPCRGATLLQAGVCTPPAADGAACGGPDANCVGPAQCVMNICRLPSAASCG